MGAFDNRLFKVVFIIGDEQVTLETVDLPVSARDLDIKAQGVKYINAMQNEMSLQIANLSPTLRNQLLTQVTPFNYDQKRKSVQLYAGRESTGLFLLYEGDITDARPSQPPDVVLNVKSKANQYWKYDIMAQAQNLNAPLSQIVSNAASGLGLTPRFEATDKLISNYSYSGARIKEVDHIGELGPYDVYTDDKHLVCKDKGKPLQNTDSTISADTGMIGQPEPTEWGVRVTTLLNQSVILGGQFTVDSEINPLMNGQYTTFKLGFNIASRDVPFYTILEGTKYFDQYTNQALPSS
jgi:hypothetical protein